MKKIFFSQQMLGSLADEGKIALEGTVLRIPSRGLPPLQLEPAYRFLRTSDGAPDPHGLVGTIRSEQAVRAMQAEAYLDSVLYRDIAYQVEPGYIGEEKEIMEKLADTELLARYLLETLL